MWRPFRFVVGLVALVASACTDLNPVQPAAQPGPNIPTQKSTPQKGGFSGNGSIHALMPKRSWLTGRWRRKHYRWNVPAHNGSARVGGFRFRSVAEAHAALNEAKRTMVFDDGGVFVSLDVPLWDREHAVTESDAQEVQLQPRVGERLMVEV